MDAESILAEVVDPRRGTNFERWLWAEGDETEALFWDVMKMGRSRGMAFAQVFRAFMKQFPNAPKFDHQTVKRLVDAKSDTNR